MQEETGLTDTIYVRVPQDLKAEIVRRAARMMVSISDIARIALAAYIRAESDDNGKDADHAE